MSKNNLDEAHEDIIFEFAALFGAKAVDLYWLLQEVSFDDPDEIKNMIRAFGVEPTDKLVEFAGHFISGMDCVHAANTSFRQAMAVFHPGDNQTAVERSMTSHLLTLKGMEGSDGK